MNSPIASDTVFSRSEDVLMTNSDDATVLMSMDTGKFVELNGSGGAIWELTDGQRNLMQVVDALQEKYAAPDAGCRDDVAGFYTTLLAENLVCRAV